MYAPAGGGEVTKTITFPEGLFTTTPAVVVSTESTASTLQSYAAFYPSKDGFTVAVRRTNDTLTRVNWIAVES